LRLMPSPRALLSTPPAVVGDFPTSQIQKIATQKTERFRFFRLSSARRMQPYAESEHLL
jgi:hypothetical protein